MSENQPKLLPHRRSIRLEDFDYSSEGGYFITIVTHHREHLFGKIISGAMQLNDIGRIIYEEWFKTQIMRPDVEVREDEFVIMPNHLHGILWLFDDGQNGRTRDMVRATCRSPVQDPQIAANAQAASSRPKGPPSRSIGAIVAGFKSSATVRINRLRNTPGRPVWLRNYYEHVINTEKEYENIVNYIAANPENWGNKDEYFS